MLKVRKCALSEWRFSGSFCVLKLILVDVETFELSIFKLASLAELVGVGPFLGFTPSSGMVIISAAVIFVSRSLGSDMF